jgi:sec-independent protein translocase protein TatB
MDEMLVIAVVAVVVIGPKDLPLALRTVGRWTAKIRKVSGHFRSGIDTMIREAEMAEMEEKWKEQNAAIMSAYPHSPPEPQALPPYQSPAEPPIDPESGDAAILTPSSSKTESRARSAAARDAEPTLPFPLP